MRWRCRSHLLLSHDLNRRRLYIYFFFVFYDGIERLIVCLDCFLGAIDDKFAPYRDAYLDDKDPSTWSSPLLRVTISKVQWEKRAA